MWVSAIKKKTIQTKSWENVIVVNLSKQFQNNDQDLKYWRSSHQRQILNSSIPVGIIFLSSNIRQFLFICYWMFVDHVSFLVYKNYLYPLLLVYILVFGCIFQMIHKSIPYLKALKSTKNNVNSSESAHLSSEYLTFYYMT